jgi:hypothetical protein
MICECKQHMVEYETKKATIKFFCPDCKSNVTKIMRAPSRILILSKRFDNQEIEAQEFIAEVIEALEDSQLATAGWHKERKE